MSMDPADRPLDIGTNEFTRQAAPADDASYAHLLQYAENLLELAPGMVDPANRAAAEVGAAAMRRRAEQIQAERALAGPQDDLLIYADRLRAEAACEADQTNRWALQTGAAALVEAAHEHRDERDIHAAAAAATESDAPRPFPLHPLSEKLQRESEESRAAASPTIGKVLGHGRIIDGKVVIDESYENTIVELGSEDRDRPSPMLCAQRAAGAVREAQRAADHPLDVDELEDVLYPYFTPDALQEAPDTRVVRGEHAGAEGWVVSEDGPKVRVQIVGRAAEEPVLVHRDDIAPLPLTREGLAPPSGDLGEGRRVWSRPIAYDNPGWLRGCAVTCWSQADRADAEHDAGVANALRSGHDALHERAEFLEYRRDSDAHDNTKKLIEELHHLDAARGRREFDGDLLDRAAQRLTHLVTLCQRFERLLARAAEESYAEVNLDGQTPEALARMSELALQHARSIEGDEDLRWALTVAGMSLRRAAQNGETDNEQFVPWRPPTDGAAEPLQDALAELETERDTYRANEEAEIRLIDRLIANGLRDEAKAPRARLAHGKALDLVMEAASRVPHLERALAAERAANPDGPILRVWREKLGERDPWRVQLPAPNDEAPLLTHSEEAVLGEIMQGLTDLGLEGDFSVTRNGPAAPEIGTPVMGFGERIERWMIDYEHAEGEPQHSVLSWIDDEAGGLPEVGTYLVRLTDYQNMYRRVEAALLALEGNRG